MTIESNIYQRISVIKWFAHCGESSVPDIGICARVVTDKAIALQGLFSSHWADTVTMAQSSLTSYLSKTDYSAYGGIWNRLVVESRVSLEKCIGQPLLAAIDNGGWPQALERAFLPPITPTVRASIGSHMADLLAAKAWSQCLYTWVLGTTTCAVMELTYRQRFPKAPAFFEKLVRVYEAGRLPCGWDGSLEEWPNGCLLIH